MLKKTKNCDARSLTQDANVKKRDNWQKTKKGFAGEKFISLSLGTSFFIHPREIQDHLKSTHDPFLLRPS